MYIYTKQYIERLPRAKRLRRLAIGLGAVCVVVTFAAVAYMYFSYQPDKRVVASASTATDGPRLTPRAPGANAPEGVAVATKSPSVRPGDQAMLSVQTNAGSRCTITVKSRSAISRASGLSPQTADAYGDAAWNWQVSKQTVPGKLSFTVTCTYRGRTGVVADSMPVVR